MTIFTMMLHTNDNGGQFKFCKAYLNSYTAFRRCVEANRDAFHFGQHYILAFEINNSNFVAPDLTDHKDQNEIPSGLFLVIYRDKNSGDLPVGIFDDVKLAENLVSFKNSFRKTKRVKYTIHEIKVDTTVIEEKEEVCHCCGCE